MPKLVHFSESVLGSLRERIAENLGRYEGDGFEDLAREPGWAIELDVDADLTALSQLDISDNRAHTDLKNSLLIEESLRSLSPADANEERLWARLSHIEAFNYTKARWLKTSGDADKQTVAVEKHFFARGQTGIRDDHSLSRLWWNAYIVKRCYEGDLARGLELLLTRADVRSNFVERIWLSGRRTLASGVFRTMDQDARVLASESSFRRFMKTLNLMGAGIVFEAMSETEIDAFLRRCTDTAESS